MPERKGDLADLDGQFYKGIFNSKPEIRNDYLDTKNFDGQGEYNVI